jgi:phage tail protein X
MKGLRLWIVLLALCVQVARAHADPTLVHVVRQGETLASIAELYYGDPRRESVLVAENGLASEGGSSIVVGLRLVIPTVGYHRAVDGETWAELATRYYGDPHRAFALIEANGGKAGEHPDIGAELLVPYPLRVVASQNDPLRKIAKAYYDSMAAMNTVRRFNTNYKNRIVRGQILLAPLADLVLSAQGKKLAEAQVGSPQLGGDLRKKQVEIDAELPVLRDHVRQGRYADAIAMGNRLIGNGDLTSSEVVTINRELGTAYVAIGSDELARDAFSALLAQQPDAEFDSVRTSPKVLHALEEARKVLAAAAAAKAAEAKDAKLHPGKEPAAAPSGGTPKVASGGSQAKAAAEPSTKR